MHGMGDAQTVQLAPSPEAKKVTPRKRLQLEMFIFQHDTTYFFRQVTKGWIRKQNQ